MVSKNFVKVLSALFFVVGIFGILAGLIISLIFTSSFNTYIAEKIPELQQEFIASGVEYQPDSLIVIFGILMAVFGLIALILSIGLWQFKKWAWLPSVVLSILMLFSFPIGTAIGAYGLVILFNKEVKSYFKEKKVSKKKRK
ncbi:MAG: hypothetical protein AABW79_03445 [Nanoarchaeota archaeon]